MEDYENVPKEEHPIEYLSVAGFFRQLPFAFHMDEINRFGAKVGAAAEGLHLAYLTAVDGKLGPVRVFPVELMMRVYEVLAVHQKWPAIVEQPAPALADGRKLSASGVRSLERLAKHLRSVIEIAPSTDLQHDAAMMVTRIETELAQARKVEAAAAPEPPAS